MPTPAVPAMPTREYGSAAWTFSMSRLAIMFPMVARRSPAMTTPPSQAIATIVVAWGAMSADSPGGSGRRPGSSSGAAALRNSVKDDVPTAVKAADSRLVGSTPTGTYSFSFQSQDGDPTGSWDRWRGRSTRLTCGPISFHGGVYRLRYSIAQASA